MYSQVLLALENFGPALAGDGWLPPVPAALSLTPNPTPRIPVKLLTALLGMSVLLGAAGPAHADPDLTGASDASDAKTAGFLDALQAAGITYGRRDLVIATAEGVCKMVAGGKSGPEVLAALRSSNPGLQAEHGSQFLAIAMQSYCPDQLVQHRP